MESIRVSISDDGVMRFLVSDATRHLLTDASKVRRASHVEPCAYVLRLLFHGLRKVCGEYGRVAEFTRTWGCAWRINLAPINGPILPETYRDRSQAIQREIDHLNAHFI